MGAFPEYKLRITRRGSRLHVEVDHFTEGPVACGSAPADWLVCAGYEDGAEWSVPMTEAQLCRTEHRFAIPVCGYRHPALTAGSAGCTDYPGHDGDHTCGGGG